MKNKVVCKKLGISAICMALCVSAAMPSTVFAQGNSQDGKEEVVYANLAGDGTLSDAYVVNIFNVKDGSILDYGDYGEVKNLTSTDEIRQSGDSIRVSTEAERFYYEGTLKDAKLPWLFDVCYYMDGKEYTAEEIAGKSGALKITVSIRQNPACKTDFFEKYALQLSLSLDTEKAENIQADGATQANVGSSRQLTYTILPDTEKEFSITADVTDFEMDDISANGIPLSMDIDVDEEELTDQIEELLDAIARLDDGATALGDGTVKLEDQAQSKLAAGSGMVAKGAAALQGGAKSLVEAANTLQGGAKTLNQSTGELAKGAASLQTGISRAGDGIGKLDASSSGLTGGSSQVKNALGAMKKGMSGESGKSAGLVSSSYEVKGAIAALSEGLTRAQQGINYESYKAGMKENGIDLDTLKSTNETAAESLQTQTDALKKQADDLRGQLEALEAACSQMDPASEEYAKIQEQTAALKQQADALDQQAGSLSDIVTLLQTNSAALGGADQYGQAYFDALTGKEGSLTRLSGGAAALKQSYADFDAGVNTLSDSVDELNQQYGSLDQGIRNYTGGVSDLADGYGALLDGAEELAEGSGRLHAGTASLYGGIEEYLKGIKSFYDATGTLKDGSGQLDEGVAQLIAGIAELSDGAKQLQDGTGEMREETDGMDTEIEEQIDELLETFTGGDEAQESFVSAKNTDVSSVQFVIKADGVSIPEKEETVETESENLSFWQKLAALFRRK